MAICIWKNALRWEHFSLLEYTAMIKSNCTYISAKIVKSEAFQTSTNEI